MKTLMKCVVSSQSELFCQEPIVLFKICKESRVRNTSSYSLVVTLTGCGNPIEGVDMGAQTVQCAID